VGITGGIGPVLSRLGSALAAEGVNVKDIVSIFQGETAVAIVPTAHTPALVIIARTGDPTRAQSELGQLEAPLAKLFRVATGSSGSGLAFKDRRIAGVTVHQLGLTPGFQFDYAVFRGMVVISTSLRGMTQVIDNSHPLAGGSSFTTALGSRPRLVTSLVFANLAQLLKVGNLTSLTGSSTWNRIQPALQRIGAVGLTSSRGPDDSTTELSIQVK
jgi:hypothetical protein